MAQQTSEANVKQAVPFLAVSSMEKAISQRVDEAVGPMRRLFAIAPGGCE